MTVFGGSNRLKSITVAALLVASVALPTLAKPAPKVEAAPVLLEARLGHARTFFRKHDYRTALLMLGDKIESLDALFIAAESNFRLDQFTAAARYFERIVETTKDPIELRKALIRLFDIDIRNKDVQSAVNRYVAYGKKYKNPPAIMRYSLGKVLFDEGSAADNAERAEEFFKRAATILRGIPKGNEFYMRARYIIAAMELGKKKPAQSVKEFGLIEKLKPVSAEDYSVRELAILAQARILAEAKREDLADQAYARVSLAGEFGETATIEAIRTMLARANEAQLGLGRFAKATPFKKQTVQSDALQKALDSVMRYRKVHEIDWHKPELLTLMSWLYVQTKRYADGRLAYDKLIGHYRPIYDELSKEATDNQVWPFFALDFERDLLAPRNIAMIEGVPAVLMKNVPAIDEIKAMRNKIEADEKKLRNLESRAQEVASGLPQLQRDRAQQTAIVDAYNAMVQKKQLRIRKEIANNINQCLAEADFDRAALVVHEMRDLKKQQNVVHDFQTKKIEEFR